MKASWKIIKVKVRSEGNTCKFCQGACDGLFCSCVRAS